LGRGDKLRSRVDGVHYTGWLRLVPRLGLEEEFAKLVSMSPSVVFEAHRFEDRLEFYGFLRGIAVPVLQRRASVRPVESPPELGQRFVAELRPPRGDSWETGFAVSEAWLSVYNMLGPGEAIQVVAHYDSRTHRELEKKARHYRLGEKPELKGLGPLEYHIRDPDKARAIAQLSRERIYIVAIRFLGDDKKRLQRLAGEAAGLITPAPKVKVSRRGNPEKLRDWEKLIGRRGPRKDLLWIRQDSFKHLVRLPRPDEVSALVEFARGGELPSITPRAKPGERCIRFGETLDGKEYCVPLRQLLHTWVVGRTRGGKSTFLWNLVLRLRETGEGAVVLIDPHGDLSYDVLESLPSLERVWLVDPGYVAGDGGRPFLASLNPLDPPRLRDREQAYDLATDHLVEMFERVLALSGTSVRIKYLLQVVLRYMYSRLGGDVTLADLYDTFLALYRGELDLPIDDPEWRRQLELLRDMSEDSFFGVFSRLEPFRNNKLLRSMTSRTTLDLDEVLRPGGLLILRLPSGAVGPQGFRLLAPMIVLRIWFWALERALLGKPRTPVYIVMDEFQNVAEAIPDVIDTILSEARKYGLILVMAHQHLHQYSEKLIRSMFTNTLVKVFFPVADARDVAALSAVDADFAEEVKRALSGLPGGSALVSVAPDFGEPPAPPTVVRMDPPPRRRASNIRPLTELLPRFAPPPEPGESDIVAKLNPVLRYLPRDRLDPVEAWVLYHVYLLSGQSGDGWAQWSDVNVRLGLPRKKADEARDRLAARGFIEATKQGNRWLVRYVRGLFEGLRRVAPGDEGFALARRALLYYFSEGYVVYPARQDPGLPSKPDLVAIPWDPSSMSLRYDKAVAVEVESCNELSTHPEQAVRNALKHRGVFQEVHLWAPAGCRGRLEELLARVEGRLPLPVRVMPPEGPGAAGDAGEGEVLEEASDAGETGVEGKATGKAGKGASREAGETDAGAPESREKAGGPENPVKRLLEAQAELLAALGKAQAEILQTQRASSEKLDKLLEAVSRMNKLLEKQARLLERLLEQHRGEENPEPEPEAPEETRTPAEIRGETGEPEQPDEQTCIPVKLDHPQGETACLPPETAQKALQLRKQGYRLLRTRTGKLYATRGTRKLALE